MAKQYVDDVVGQHLESTKAKSSISFDLNIRCSGTLFRLNNFYNFRIRTSPQAISIKSCGVLSDHLTHCHPRTVVGRLAKTQHA